MAPAALIQPQQSATPSGSSLGRTGDRSIPSDLLREASQRVAVMSLLAAMLWVVATVMWHVTWPSLHPGMKWPGLRFPDAISAFAALTSLGLYAYIRRQDRDPQFLLNLGLVYLVVTAFEIALVMHPAVPTGDSQGPQLTWIGVVILMFAAVVPSSPRKTFAASLLAASMSPLAMTMTKMPHMNPLERFASGLLMHYPDFLLVGVAVVIARVVTRLGQQVSKAREMGSYQLGDLLKRGGMGEIYKATHRMLARPAAIKLIRAEMLGGEDADSADLAVRRFHREAEAAANLRSPHTVELFDFGVTEDHTLYFVMELLDGMDLESMVRKHGPLPARRVVHILRQVCESLEEAHAQGLVHRDIKPANIHLGKVGMRHDFVKVLDFGLVKSVKAEPTGESLATAVGRTPGTPAYMAPEMAVGEHIDARSDIYALGCVAYYLLTGKLVFDVENTFQMVAKHLRNQPVPPSLRAGVEVPRPLEEIVLACLAKKPDDRPQSAADLDRALAAIRIAAWTEAEAAEWWKKGQSIATDRSLPSARDAAPAVI